MKYYPLMILMFLYTVIGCSETARLSTIESGVWRGELLLQNQRLPFNFEVEEKGKGEFEFSLLNGTERLSLGSAQAMEDSIIVPLFIFDASLALKMESKSKLRGHYIKHDAVDYQIPLEAMLSNERFERSSTALISDISGKWAFTFTTKEGREIAAVGVFESDKTGKVEGSIVTATGDYRFLEGFAENGELRLSTFDGAHAYLFHASISEEGKTIENGEFWSGKGGYRTFSAIKDPNVLLEDRAKEVYLKDGYDKIEFSFPDSEGKMISLSDSQFEKQVVILQVFGSWCPNCMDETIFLTDWYKKNKERGVEIIGLAYEVKDDFNYAASRIKRVKDRIGAPYTFLVAGTNNEASLSETLPMLSKVPAYPTMIILDRNKDIHHIHTGFTGPGTGEYYTRFVTEFNQIMDSVIDE